MRSHTGALAYNSYVATRAQRGRALTSELRGGNESRISAAESAAIVRRATKLLPAEHGQVTVRGDSGIYAVALMNKLRALHARFTFSAPQTSTMWRALGEIAENAWADAVAMRGAQVAEIAYTPAGWQHCDNGPEMTSNALIDRCQAQSTATSYIDPGAPWQNPFVESFPSRVRDELLNLELFSCLAEAGVLIEDWREDYNQRRPHSALGRTPPAAFAAAWAPDT